MTYIGILPQTYISCANKAFGFDRKHDNHLALLQKMFLEDKMQDKILECKKMKEAFEIIESYPLIGDFMAYQLVTDINYSDVVDWKENVSTKMEGGIVLKNYLQLKIDYDRIHLNNVVSINTIICYEVRQ